jgi:hypothetical protein
VDQTYIQRLRVSNLDSEFITLWLEPWGDMVSIPLNVSVEIVASGPEGDHLEVTCGERRISVYGWSGSILSVFKDGDRLVECNVPVPHTPPFRGC